MSHELICAWLELPADAWPPDHYRLLGLEPGEEDLALIEQRVHLRLDAVRKYQAKHPEQATEAMNRLAQAFVCLTEPTAKREYDLRLPGVRRSLPPPPPVRVGPPVRVPPLPANAPPPLPGAIEVAAAPRDPLIWLYTPGANSPVAPPPPVRSAPPEPEPEAQVAVAEPPPPLVEPAPLDPVVAAATTSPQVRRGLSTRKALESRSQHTRELLELWKRLEQYLADPHRPLSKQEASELYKLAGVVEEAVGDFPLLGEAGQPGYLIINLTQLERARDLLNLTLLQRESLERDWRAGLRFLEAHRDLLEAEAECDRCRGWMCRLVRRVRAALNEQPLTAFLVLIALTAVAVAVWRSTW